MIDSVTGPSDLSSIVRIEEGGLHITSRGQLISIIENPILEACQIIFDKNIETIMSSANPVGGYYIDFASDSLSRENRETLLDQFKGVEGTMHGSEPRRKYIKIKLDNPNDITEVSEWGLEIANALQKQELTWGGFTLQTLEALSGGMNEEDYDGNNQIEYWEASGYFYNPNTQLFYSSQEMYDKSLK